MKNKILIVGLLLVVMVIGCEKNDADSNSISTQEGIINAKIDMSNDDIQQVVEEEFNKTDLNGTSGRPIVEVMTLPACAVVTRIPAFGVAIPVGTLVTKTINFGTTGCALANGNVLKGKIIIKFLYNPPATSHTIAYDFDGFYHNNIKITGNRNITRSLTAATVASPAHPIVTMNMDITAKFPNGNVYNRVGTRVREIIEGFSTAIFADNVYKVTGNWTTTFPNTTTQNSTITSPLIIKAICPNIVQGTITYIRAANTATLDYGNGTCDNQAVFTYNGVASTITLGN